MNHQIKQVLFADFLLGSSAGMAGIIFFSWFSRFLGLPPWLFLSISIVTFVYSLFAFWLTRGPAGQRPVYILINANFAWALISIILLFVYFDAATLPGRIYLVLQILVVGGLAWLEQKLLRKQVS